MNFTAINTIALAAIINPDDAAYYRSVCRWFSKEFSTPIEHVETLHPDYVLQHYLESRLAQLSEDEKLTRLFKTLDPNWDETEETETEEFIEMILERDRQRKAKKLRTTQEQQSLPQGFPKEALRVYPDDSQSVAASAISKPDDLHDLDDILKL